MQPSLFNFIAVNGLDGGQVPVFDLLPGVSNLHEVMLGMRVDMGLPVYFMENIEATPHIFTMCCSMSRSFQNRIKN